VKHPVEEKHKREKPVSDDEDEEVEELLPRALPVELSEVGSPSVKGRPSKRVRHDGPPRTGAEYLLMVRHEAAACPQVVVAKNRASLLASPSPSVSSLTTSSSTTSTTSTPSVSSRFSSIRHSLLEGLSSSLPPPLPVHLVPSPEWVDSFLLTFASWRLNLERLASSRALHRTTKLPKLEDERGWRLFCFGSDGDNAGSLPTTSLVGSLNQRQTLQLIQYHTTWLVTDNSITPQQSRWLFSLLLRVDKVRSLLVLFFRFVFMCGHGIFAALQLLTADMTDALRSLCRKCLEIRQHLATHGAVQEGDEAIAALNVVIVVVSKYFQQRDLCDAV